MEMRSSKEVGILDVYAIQTVSVENSVIVSRFDNGEEVKHYGLMLWI